MNYNPELISFLTTDNLKLPGVLYQPEEKTKKVAIYLHGNGGSSIFYSSTRFNTLAKHLNGKGITFFPFNNRGAHYIMSLKRKIDEITEERVNVGMTYEIIKDCIHDIDGAIAFLKEKGYEEFYLIGHSTGANKICVYNYYNEHNSVAKYILLAGGDDTGIYYNELGKIKFNLTLQKCKEMIEKGKEMNIVPKKMSPYFPMSYQALYDTINPDGDYNVFPFNEVLNDIKLSKKELFREYKKLDKPTFVVYGEFDEYCYENVDGCVEVLKKEVASKKNFSYAILPGADHGFTDKDEELGREISDWICK